MKRTWIWIGVAVIAAGVTLGLSRTIWPDPVGGLKPPGGLLPFFIVLAAAESIVFGVGIAFMMFGFGIVARTRQPLWLTYAAYAAIVWLLVSWWPHDNLHRVTIAGNWGGLLGIEYGFHLTLMASAVVLAVFFLRVMRAAGSADYQPAARRGAADLPSGS